MILKYVMTLRQTVVLTESCYNANYFQCKQNMWFYCDNLNPFTAKGHLPHDF